MGELPPEGIKWFRRLKRLHNSGGGGYPLDRISPRLVEMLINAGKAKIDNGRLVYNVPLVEQVSSENRKWTR